MTTFTAGKGKRTDISRRDGDAAGRVNGTELKTECKEVETGYKSDAFLKLC